MSEETNETSQTTSQPRQENLASESMTPTQVVLGVIALGVIGIVLERFVVPWYAAASIVLLCVAIAVRFHYRKTLGQIIMLAGVVCMVASLFAMFGELGRRSDELAQNIQRQHPTGTPSAAAKTAP